MHTIQFRTEHCEILHLKLHICKQRKMVTITELTY